MEVYFSIFFAFFSLISIHIVFIRVLGGRGSKSSSPMNRYLYNSIGLLSKIEIQSGYWNLAL